MNTLNDLVPDFNKYIKFNFDGGDLSSDGGLLLLKEFIHKIGFERLVQSTFNTDDCDAFRKHKDAQNLMQVIYQTIGAYFTDDCADELTNDPVFKAILGKGRLASQPTLSRFHNRLNEKTLEQFTQITKTLRRIAYSCEPPEQILLDIDSTLLNTYGMQDGSAFNYHYSAKGYHPLVCFDGLTGDLLKVDLRDDTDYCSNGAKEFLEPLFLELRTEYPQTNLYLRGDSGFAAPEIYELCEAYDVSFIIRLKSNAKVERLAIERGLDKALTEITRHNAYDYAVCYDEFSYQAKSWDHPHRVVAKVEKPTGQFIHQHTYIVTNMQLPPEDVIKVYCNRGRMENFIKEGKSGFNFGAVSSASKTINANRLQVHALAYNLFNLFKRFALPDNLKYCQVDTLRIKIMKVAARVIHTARYTTFKLASSCPYKKVFYSVLSKIKALTPLLE